MQADGATSRGAVAFRIWHHQQRGKRTCCRLARRLRRREAATWTSEFSGRSRSSMTEDGSQSGRDGSRHSRAPAAACERGHRGRCADRGALARRAAGDGSEIAPGVRLEAAEAAGGRRHRHLRAGHSLRVGRDQLDLLRFERLVGGARGRVLRPQQRRFAMRSRWRGAPLASSRTRRGPVGSRSPGGAGLAALEDRIDADLALGRHADVVGELEVLVSGNLTGNGCADS